MSETIRELFESIGVSIGYVVTQTLGDRRIGISMHKNEDEATDFAAFCAAKQTGLEEEEIRYHLEETDLFRRDDYTVQVLTATSIDHKKYNEYRAEAERCRRAAEEEAGAGNSAAGGKSTGTST